MHIFVDRNAGPGSISLRCSFLIYGTIRVVKSTYKISIVTDLHISNSKATHFVMIWLHVSGILAREEFLLQPILKYYPP
jgi:hypothetical protein